MASAGSANFKFIFAQGNNQNQKNSSESDNNKLMESLQHNYHQGGSVVNQRSSDETGLNEDEFWFRPRTGFIDWRTIKKVKTKDMITDGVTDLLPYLVPNLTMGRLQTVEDFKHLDDSEYLAKFFKLLQYANEHQENQVKLAFAQLKETEQEYNQIYTEVMQREQRVKDKQKKIHKNRTEMRKKDHLLVSSQLTLLDSLKFSLLYLIALTILLNNLNIFIMKISKWLLLIMSIQMKFDWKVNNFFEKDPNNKLENKNEKQIQRKLTPKEENKSETSSRSISD